MRSSVSHRGVLAASAPQLSCPTALLPHSLGSHTWGAPVLPAPLLALAHELAAGNGKAGEKPQERGGEAMVISLL